MAEENGKAEDVPAMTPDNTTTGESTSANAKLGEVASEAKETTANNAPVASETVSSEVLKASGAISEGAPVAAQVVSDPVVNVETNLRSVKVSNPLSSDEIPVNPTIVIKNLPYELDMGELEGTLRRCTAGAERYKTFNPHTDPAGNFRGIVFINYKSLSDASKAFQELATLDVGGRKVRVEYRRLKAGERPPQDDPVKPPRKFKELRSDEANWRLQKPPPNDSKKAQEVELRREYQKVLQVFIDRDESLGLDDTIEDLTNFQRKIVHLLAEEMGLGHKSSDLEDGRRVIMITKDPSKVDVWRKESRLERIEAEMRRKEMKQKKNAAAETAAVEDTKKYEEILRAFLERDESEGLDYDFTESLTNQELRTIHRVAEELGLGHKVENKDGVRCMICTKDPQKIEAWQKLEASDLKGLKWTVPRAHRNGEGENDENGPYNVGAIPRYIPPRQPKGPDGTRGFRSRNLQEGDECAV